jgi:hypothetical protein
MEHFILKNSHYIEGNKIPWWSYAVKKGDANYEQRQDKSVDFFELDSDQNFQIEIFYQDCIKGITSKFGDVYTIVGDLNCVKTGHKYKVWGSSEDPSSWFEKNATLAGAPKR